MSECECVSECGSIAVQILSNTLNSLLSKKNIHYMHTLNKCHILKAVSN